MAGALHLLPVFLLCGYSTLTSAGSEGDLPAARRAFAAPGGLSSAGTRAPASADHTSSKPVRSSTAPHPLSFE